MRVRGFDARDPQKMHDLRISRSKRCSISDDRSNHHPSLTGSGVLEVEVSRSSGEREVDSLPPMPPHVFFLCLLLAAVAVVVLIAFVIGLLHWRAKKDLQYATEEEQRLDREEEAPTIDQLQPVMKAPLSDRQMNFLQQPYDGISQQQKPQLPSHLERPGSQVSGSNPPPPPPPPPPSHPPPDHLPSLQGRSTGMAALDGAIMSDAESRVESWVQSQQRVSEQGHRETDPAVMQVLQVDRLRLKLGQLLQEGTFGRVYQVCMAKIT